LWLYASERTEVNMPDEWVMHRYRWCSLWSVFAPKSISKLCIKNFSWCIQSCKQPSYLFCC
jgi:hypothetical protein